MSYIFSNPTRHKCGKCERETVTNRKSHPGCLTVALGDTTILYCQSCYAMWLSQNVGTLHLYKYGKSTSREMG